MKEFKFFKKETPLFQTEITNYIERTSDSSMMWSMEYSERIREWLSELFFTNTFTDPNNQMKYIHQIDRTCELIEIPVVMGSRNQQSLFSAKVKIWRTDEDWIVVYLAYPINHIIYRP